MNIFIAGGSGFIGSRLAAELVEQGHQVTLYDIASPPLGSQTTFIQGDVRDLHGLTSALPGHDLVINLAAEHRDDVRPISRYDEVNVDGARILCEAMTRTGLDRLIFTSSVAVYGVHPGAIREDAAHNFFNDYGRTKHEAEVVYRAWQKASPSRSLGVLRPTVVFGPGNRGNVYNLVKQVKSGTFLMVGSGLNKKSIAHVDNVVGFIIHLSGYGAGVRTFNYADKPDFTMKELVDTVCETLGRSANFPRLPYGAGLMIGKVADIISRVTGRSLPISTVRIEKFCMSSEIDANAAFDAGYTPPLPLKDGLRDFVLNHA